MNDVLYLDCEFTHLIKPELLSLALVSFRGDEHYVELELNDPASVSTLKKCSEFVRENNVLAQWGRVPDSACSRQQMGERTAKWVLDQVARIGRPVQIAFDHPPDFDLFRKLVLDAGLWPAIEAAVRPLDVSEETGRFDAQLASGHGYQAMLKRGLERHHALADAYALRAAMYGYNTGKRPPL